MRCSLRSDSRTIAVADQAVSSLTNFGLAGLSIVLLSTTDVGNLAVVQAIYGLALAIVRAWYLEPGLVVADPGEPPEHHHRRMSLRSAAAVRRSFGAGFVLAGAAGLFLHVMNFSFVVVILVLAGFPLLMAQDALRYVGFARLRPILALENDAAWLLGQIAVIVAIGVGPWSWSVELLLLAWVAGGTFAAVLVGGLFRLRVVPDRHSAELLADLRPVRPGLVVELAVGRIAPSVGLVIAALILTRSEVGEVSIPRTILGPTTVLFIGLVSYGTAQAARLFRSDYGGFQKYCRKLRQGLTMLSVAVTLGAVALVGLLGNALADVPPDRLALLVAIVGLGTCFAAVGHGYRVEIRASGDTGLSGRAQLQTGIMIIIVGLLGAILFGAVGMVAGVAAAQAIGLVFWYLAVRESRQRHESRSLQSA